MAAITDQKTKQEYGSLSISSASSPTKTETKPGPRLLWLALAVVSLFALAAAAWYWRDSLAAFYSLLLDQEQFSAYLQSYGALGPAILAGVQLLQVLIAVIPGHVFLIAAGYIYGFPLGLAMNVTFTVIASQICFLLARWAGRPVVVRFVDSETVDYWERIANQKGVAFFTISFMLPVFPSDAMNFVAGLSGISSRRFLVANFIGRLPSAIMLTMIGSHGLEMSNEGWLAIGILGVVAFFFGRYIVDRLTASARLPQPQNDPA